LTKESAPAELVKALLEYKKIKQVSTVLDEMAENMRRRYFRKDFSAWNVSEPEPELLKVDLAALMIAFGDVLRRAEAVSTLEIRPQEITVESRKEYILSLLKSNSGVEFEDLFGDDPRKIVLVVTFIALLDLVKDGILRIEQADRFSTIRVYVNNREPALIEES
jgi:segregation and condensation protein A